MTEQNPAGEQKPRTDRPRRASARAVEFRALEVTLQDGNFNRAMSMLKRKMANEGIYKELRKRRFYEKPSAQRKRKREAAIRRERRRQRRNERR